MSLSVFSGATTAGSFSLVLTVAAELKALACVPSSHLLIAFSDVSQWLHCIMGNVGTRG